MTWLADVVAGAGNPITPTWGNTIRNRTVHPLNSRTDVPAPADGMLVYETSTDLLLVREGSSWSIVANGSASSRPGVTVSRPAPYAAAIAAATDTVYAWTHETDPFGFSTCSVGTPDSTLVVPANLDGLYLVGGLFVWSADPGVGGEVVIELGPSAAPIEWRNGPPGARAWQSHAVHAGPYPLSAGDQCRVRLHSTGAVNVTCTVFVLQRIGR